MTLSRISSVFFLAAFAATSLSGPQRASSFDVFWLPAGSGDWNAGANWSDSPGGGARGAIPRTAFEEIGVIINGGTATLAVTASQNPGGVSLGYAPANLLAGTGTLTINSGGSLTSVASGSTDGAVVVGSNTGTGMLNMNGTAILAAPNLTSGGAAASAVNLSGTATLNLGGANLSRNLTITGSSVNFNSTGTVTLTGANVYNAVINSLTAHSPLKSSAGAVSIGGTLNVQFSGVTPVPGNSWTLADGVAVSGNFANAPLGTDVAVAGASPAVGSAFRLSNVAGGAGRQLKLSLDRVLVLTVNRDTGAMTLRNPLGSAVTQLTGYEVDSARGALLSSYKGISGAPAGNAGWEKAPTNSTTGLAEFKPTGVFDVSSAATSVSLGTGFNKTAGLSGLGVAGLGTTNEDLAFTYTNYAGAVVRGQVEYTGAPFYNDMILSVTTSGVATLKNDSTLPLLVDGYSIVSSTNSLSGAGWTSLDDRVEARFDGWGESPAAANALSETNSNESNVLTIAAGESFSLGDIGDFATQAAKNGLQVKYILRNENAVRFAQVKFVTSIPGDYDNDGDVDGNDVLVWQRGGSPNPNSASDLAAIEANFGQPVVAAGNSAATAIPEPACAALCLVGLLASGATRRRG